MRVIHLCFQLHLPADLQKLRANDTDYEADFATANKEIYQPLFALLERNTQKHKKFKVSLVVSGLWLESAAKYDYGLIDRLRRLVERDQVELVAEPYYHSLAFFYDRAELTEQVKRQQDKLETLFGRRSRIFALPELIYNDGIGQWAEGFGFAGMLVGGSPEALAWRSPNHVYEAAGCKYLRLLFRNSKLCDLLTNGQDEILVEKETDGTTRSVISLEKFEKQLELATLRGGLVNLYFDAGLLQRRREEGIIGFFDELFTKWLKVSGNHFVSASQACVAETPKTAVSIPIAVSMRGDAKTEESSKAVAATPERILPEFLSHQEQLAASQKLYALERVVLASEDEALIDEYRHLTTLDYLLAMTPEALKDWENQLQALGKRVDEVKKTKIIEISKALTKRPPESEVKPKEQTSVNDEDDTRVVVHFGSQRTAGTTSRKVHVVAEASQVEVPVHRLTPTKPERVDAGVEKPKKHKGFRKVIHKLVIE